MSRYYAYLNKAVTLLEQYKGQQPFSVFCKQQFSQDRRLGATDRKLIRHYCYCFFRMGKALPHATTQQRLLAGVFCCSQTADPLLQLHCPDWNQQVGLPLAQKLQLVAPGKADSLAAVFPYQDRCSASLFDEDWIASLFTQPRLFIRPRPGRETVIKEALQQQGIAFEEAGEHAIALPNTTSLDSWPGWQRDFVIQDLNSQRIALLLSLLPARESWQLWDCCAASGGKSLLAVDHLGAVNITASDNRSHILQQLHHRFAQAGITDYRALPLDLSRTLPASFTHGPFDLVWADVPCTGSGTWSRTPEQLYFFDPASIDELASLQRTLLTHALEQVRPGGYLLYSTCSVFAQENEEQVAWLQTLSGLKLVEQRLFNGASERADTLFAALLHKKG